MLNDRGLDIVIVADFCGNFDGKDNSRFTYLAHKFIESKNKVEIVTSDFSHGKKAHFTPKISRYNGAEVTMLPEPAYRKNVSIKRFWSHYIWGKNVGRYLKKRNKPDVVYCAMPTLTAAASVGRYCNKHGVKFVIDIQDLWPEAYKMVFNVPIVSSAVFLPFKLTANAAYRRADEIVAVSQTYVDRALEVNKNVENGHAVFLGTDLETFDNGARLEPFIKKEEKDGLWLGFCGSLSASYDIPCVLRALKALKDKEVSVPKFVIMGDGALRQAFEEEAQELGVDTLFTGWLPYETMCATLKQCDMLVNPIKKGSAASIINKHGDYAAAGLPVINTQESREYMRLVDEYEMGFNCENGNADDVAQKIEYLIVNEDKRRQMGLNSRKCAEQRFDRNNTYPELLSVL